MKKRFFKIVSLFVAVLVLVFVVIPSLQIFESQLYLKNRENYFSTNEFSFSGKIEKIQPISISKKGRPNFVAVELFPATFNFKRINNSETILGAVHNTSKHLIFYDFDYDGYVENKFDSISFESKKELISYYKEGELLKQEEVLLSYKNSIGHNAFKKIINNKLGDNITFF